MSILEALGAAPVLDKKNREEKAWTENRKRIARKSKRLMKQGLFEEAAKLLSSKYDQIEDEQPNSSEPVETKPVETKADEILDAAQDPEPETNLKPETEEKPEQPEREIPNRKQEPETKSKPATIDKIKIPEFLKQVSSSKEERLSDATAEIAERREQQEERKLRVVPPVKFNEEDEEMKRSWRFYSELPDMAQRYDESGEMDDDFRKYIREVIIRDPELIEEILEDNLPIIIERNPAKIPEIEKMIVDAANRDIRVKALLVNTKDSDCQAEYETWDEAVASISKEIKAYGVNPQDVFAVIWREINEDGSLGNQLYDQEVEDYIQNFRGDKENLRRLLRKTFVKAEESSGSGKSGKANKGTTASSRKKEPAGKKAEKAEKAKSSQEDEA